MAIINGEFTVIVDGEEYTKGQIRMLMRAVRRALKATSDQQVTHTFEALMETAEHIGLLDDKTG